MGEIETYMDNGRFQIGPGVLEALKITEADFRQMTISDFATRVYDAGFSITVGRITPSKSTKGHLTVTIATRPPVEGER